MSLDYPVAGEGGKQSFEYHAKYYLQPGEFNDKTDILGAFEQEGTTQKFFLDPDVKENIFPKLESGTVGQPYANIEIYLSEKKHIYER